MPDRIDSQVLVVGAGPVGLTLAIALGRLGVRCTLIEKKDAPQFLPKMERCNARTMEIYRRLGVADAIRAAGLRSDVPMDVFVALALNQPPLLHLRYPSVDEARAQIAACTDGSLPLEPYQLISQYTLEPLLKAEVEKIPSLDVRFGCELVSVTQDASAVTAQVRTGDGATTSIIAQYLVGCDGGGSTVRRELGIGLRGEGNIAQLYQGLYYCPELFDRLPIGNGPGRGRHYHIADAASTFLIMQDSTRHWTLHASVTQPEDMAAQFARTIGEPLPFDLLYVGAWKLNLLLADRYRHGRIFLAGDAVHLVIPTGGLGMNSGVGDAIDLAWKFAGTLRGWGGAHLLDSYEIERRQVGDRNIGASRYAFLGRRRWRSQYRPCIGDASPEGQEARDALTRVAAVEQRKSNEMIGAELGYRYVGSPIIWDEPGGPEHLFREYVPTTWPGARLPHVWLDDGRAIQDVLGEGYTLLRLGRTGADSSALEAAMRERGAPLKIAAIADDVARDLYGYDLLLLRPDLHVAWRGHRAPENAAGIAAIVTGHGDP